jgi:hypothetical protein
VPRSHGATAKILPLAAALLLAPGARAEPPPEGRCPVLGGALSDGTVTDAVPRRIGEGMRIGYDSLLSLRELLPEEVWGNRHVFFYTGMEMVIGPCHRRYATPAFFREATERFAGGVSLDAEGNLHGYTAGLPFPPAAIDPAASDAGIRWAWNLEYRFRGAGPVGSFRIADIPSRLGSVLEYRGEFFLLRTRHRADLAETGYREPDADGEVFVAGGRFHTPLDARHLAWRQLRPESSETRYSVPDDTFVYVPTMRKVRRAATPWVDGMYMPRYRVAGDAGGGSIPIGGNDYQGPSGAISPTAAASIHQTENLARGFTLLALRPNAYVWRVRGEREVLAPLNGHVPGHPIDSDRNYGPHGLSVASDRWDVRWAVVIEGKPRNEAEPFERLVVYVDHQTQQPLYVVTRGSRGRILEVGIPVHRFSDDVVNYPGWPNGERAGVFDPVAEVVYRLVDDSGWRRESYDVRSTPADERVRRRFTSTDYLVRGR